MPLTLETYRAAGGIFPVSSTLVLGEQDAILIDAQFQLSKAEELVDRIRGSGRRLTTIFVSHSDPDFYFGLDTLHRHFPEARILSTPQTAWLIDTTKDAKLAVWRDALGADAPKELIVPEAVTGTLELEGQTIEIRQAPDDPGHAFLWIPSLRAIVGGVALSAGMHPWLADTPDAAALDQWIARLDDMAALEPAVVIASHAAGAETTSPEVITANRRYLEDWGVAVTQSADAAALIATMDRKYPGLPARESLETSAKVAKGEMPWTVTELYPAIGRKAVVDFGGFSFQLDFADHRRLTFTGLTGDFKGLGDTVFYTAVPIRPAVYMVYWSEPNSTKANVVHVQDYENGIVHTNIAMPDLSFTNLKGELRLVE